MCLRVVLPAHDDVVRSHAVRDFVAAQGGGIGQAARHAAGGRHDVHFGVAVVLGRERQLLAVGRKAGEHFVALVAGQLAGHPAG